MTVKREATKEYAEKVIILSNNHFKRYGYKKMSLQELDKLFGV